MSDKEGILRMMASGRWAVYRAGRLPVEITSGELFRVEVAGVTGLQLTRMEYNHPDRRYYSGRLSTARWSARRDRCAWVKSSKGVCGSSRLSWSSCRCNQRQGT
jgi:hypothetical protein